ncbi:MAG: hypothetical protein ACPL0B_00615, partial [Anaerolineales bacterium]
FSTLEAGVQLANPIPVIFINEPIFISHGKNSNLRYNFYYPRWAYDDFRLQFAEQCQNHQWNCWDIWNLIPPQEFTNTAIHMTPNGTQQTANWIANQIQNWLQAQP